MRKVAGKITCETNDPIEENSTVSLAVYDASAHIRCCRTDPSILLGEKTMTASSFPIEYEMEYEDKTPVKMDHVWYYLTVRIEKEGVEGSFCTGAIKIVKNEDHESGPILENVDVVVTYYPPS
jgi:hypothetical protein